MQGLNSMLMSPGLREMAKRRQGINVNPSERSQTDLSELKNVLGGAGMSGLLSTLFKRQEGGGVDQAMQMVQQVKQMVVEMGIVPPDQQLQAGQVESLVQAIAQNGMEQEAQAVAQIIQQLGGPEAFAEAYNSIGGGEGQAQPQQGMEQDPMMAEQAAAEEAAMQQQMAKYGLNVGMQPRFKLYQDGGTIKIKEEKGDPWRYEFDPNTKDYIAINPKTKKRIRVGMDSKYFQYIHEKFKPQVSEYWDDTIIPRVSSNSNKTTPERQPAMPVEYNYGLRYDKPTGDVNNSENTYRYQEGGDPTMSYRPVSNLTYTPKVERRPINSELINTVVMMKDDRYPEYTPVEVVIEMDQDGNKRIVEELGKDTPAAKKWIMDAVKEGYTQFKDPYYNYARPTKRKKKTTRKKNGGNFNDPFVVYL